MGTIYRNRGVDEEDWNDYAVTELKENEIFELSSDNYHVRYTYKEIDHCTEMEYFEWVDNGDLEDPFTNKTMEKLKEVIGENK